MNMRATETLDTRARRAFLLVLLIAFLWLNASEVFRYFAFVMPMTRDAMSGVQDVAPMNLTVFMIWGLWDTLLFAVVCIIAWLFHEKFGGGTLSAIAAGTLLWLTVFCVFWLAVWNMNLTVTRVPLIALPLAWIEMVVVVAILQRAWPHLQSMSRG
jgi:hypothetical protein